MMGAAQYTRAVVAHGTVGIYWDPHEVANVVGLQGVKVVKDVRRRLRQCFYHAVVRSSV
ncbi:MAG: hypothetical protein ACLT98_12205 [Eggerthellaceae bacterium]